MMEQQELSHWLALLRAPYIGSYAFAQILNLFPTLSDFFRLDSHDYQQLNLHAKTIVYLQNPDWEGVDADLCWASKSPHHFIVTLLDKDYPLLLLQTADPPPILFIKGELAVLNQPQMAIIGSRNPSPGGKNASYRLASDLGRAGLVITSGLALGIDTAAHRGALETTKTIAVVGTGLNIYYPRFNQSLAEKISQQGAIMSEFYYDTPAYPRNFPRRNRLISGLCLGTLVVEANLKSGSLITAGYALEQGREVFAVPGSIYNPKAQGCHLLLKQGAKLVENANDVLEELRIYDQKTYFNPSKSLDLKQKTLEDDHLKLLECVGYEPTKIDTLVERSHYSVSKVASILADLELAGHVCSTVGSYTRVSE